MATVRLIQRSKKSYTIVIDHGIDPVTKKRKKETRTVETTEPAVAELAKLEVLKELAQGIYKPTSKTTVKEYFESWFNTPAAKKLQTKTFIRYKQLADLRVIPWLGHIRLRDLKRSDLASFYQKIIDVGQLENPKKIKNPDPNSNEIKDAVKPKKEISSTTILHHHRFICRVLNHAIYEDELLARNVASRMDLPVPDGEIDEDEDYEAKVFSNDEIIALEKAAASTPFANLIAVALRTGLRREELLALTWDCIDFEKSTLTVKRALIHTSLKGYELKATKNTHRRTIEVSEEVITAFRAEEIKQNARKEHLRDKGRDGQGNKVNLYDDKKNLIFCRGNGDFVHPDTPSKWFPKFCVKLKITRLGFHCLRHTHASHLLSAGEDITYVSKRLGHAGITITFQTYLHFIPQEKRESLKELEKRFKKPSEENEQKPE